MSKQEIQYRDPIFDVKPGNAMQGASQLLRSEQKMQNRHPMFLSRQKSRNREQVFYMITGNIIIGNMYVWHFLQFLAIRGAEYQVIVECGGHSIFYDHSCTDLTDCQVCA